MQKSNIRRRLISSLLAVVIAVMFIVPFTGNEVVKAGVEQPDITITPLDEIHCASYCVYDLTADTILLEQQSHNSFIFAVISESFSWLSFSGQNETNSSPPNLATLLSFGRAAESRSR